MMTEPMLEGTGCAMHEPFALQVLGLDMEPEFPDKCIVLVEPTASCRSGMYVFAEVEGVRWFRQYRRDGNGAERLIALNDAFPDIALNGLEWKVLGVIIQRNIRRRIKHYEYADGAAQASATAGAPSPSINAVDITGSA
jgi:SOS-response transcriptional repressor LexA